MANHKSALKRIRSSARKRERNRTYQAKTRTQVKKALTTINTGNNEEALAETRKAIALLDKSANKGIIHKANAARRKSRLMKRLNNLEQA